MSHKSRKPIGEQFAPVLDALLGARVWYLLPIPARALWPEVVRAQGHQGRGDRSAPFVVPQQHLHYAKHTMHRALRAFCDLGLLEIHRHGGLDDQRNTVCPNAGASGLRKMLQSHAARNGKDGMTRFSERNVGTLKR